MRYSQIPEPKSTRKSSPPAEPPKNPSAGGGFSHGSHYPNFPESMNPDLRDELRFIIRQYSKWYADAWGTAILAGLSFFALGWVIKGSNPLPSFKADSKDGNNSSSSSSGDKDKAAVEVHEPR